MWRDYPIWLTVCVWTLARDVFTRPLSQLYAASCEVPVANQLPQFSWLIIRCLLLFAVFVGLRVLLGVSLVAIQIYTGRRHQIRAHARFMGWLSYSTSNGAISKSIPMLWTHISDSYLYRASIPWFDMIYIIWFTLSFDSRMCTCWLVT